MHISNEQFDLIYNSLLDSGRFSYGITIHQNDFYQIFDIASVEVEDLEGLSINEIKKAFTEQAFQVLEITEEIRSRLLDLGRYFGQFNNNFRVMLPSENLEKAKLIQMSAQRKLARAKQLILTTPKAHKEKDNIASLNMFLMDKSKQI